MLMRSVLIGLLVAVAALAVGAQPVLAAASTGKGTAATGGTASAAPRTAAPAPTGKAPLVPTATAGKALPSSTGAVGVSSPTGSRGPAALTGSPAGAAPEAAPTQRISAIQSAILGLIQGLTEYLPVSSTGHLILANYAMGLSHFSDRVGPLGRVMEDNEAVDDFDIILHFGTWLAVLGLYRGRVWQMMRGIAGKDPSGAWLLLMLAVAFIPAAIAGLAGKRWIQENLYNPVTVATALAVGGALMIVVEILWRKYRRPDRITDITRMQLWQAAAIGLAQVLALWPGTSRSMITILAALVVGIDLVAAAEFSFLLALPTLGAATAFTALKHGGDMMRTVSPDAMAIGLAVTAIVAFFAMKGLIKWLTGHGLAPFGVYRIALAAAVYVYFFVIS